MNQSVEKISWIIATPRNRILRECTLSAAIRHNMVEEWLRSETEAVELRFASVVDADRTGLLAIGERGE
jgi:hypothetical protein